MINRKHDKNLNIDLENDWDYEESNYIDDLNLFINGNGDYCMLIDKKHWHIFIEQVNSSNKNLLWNSGAKIHRYTPPYNETILYLGRNKIGRLSCSSIEYYTATNNNSTLLNPFNISMTIKESVYYEDRFINNFETFSMTIKDYNILTNKNTITTHRTKNIEWSDIIKSKYNRYIKPY